MNYVCCVRYRAPMNEFFWKMIFCFLLLLSSINLCDDRDPLLSFLYPFESIYLFSIFIDVFYWNFLLIAVHVEISFSFIPNLSTKKLQVLFHVRNLIPINPQNEFHIKIDKTQSISKLFKLNSSYQHFRLSQKCSRH